MFTGIVQALGTVRSRTAAGRLEIDLARDAKAPAWRLEGEPLALGESIAVSGVCLTVVKRTRSGFAVDVSPETFRCTSLERLKAGSRVNLERALTLSTRLGGHLVSGHVDTTCRLVKRAREGGGERHTFELPRDFARYVAFKGSVTLDGVSLTVARRTPRAFDVALIPHTLEVTTLSDRKPGDLLNLEVDLVARYLETLLGGRKVRA